MPRACSSGRRSVSLPVSARTSHVLPWSMWPAVPTVEDCRQEIDIAARHPLEEAAGDEADPVPEACLVAPRLGEIEDDSLEFRSALEQGAQERTVSPTDVDDGLVAEPVELGQSVG